MANYQSNYTGAQIDEGVEKGRKLPATTSADSGKTLQVDSNGNFVANTVSGGGVTSINKVTGNIVIDDLNFSSYDYHFRFLPNIPYKFDTFNSSFGGPIYYLGYKASASQGVNDILFGYHYLSHPPYLKEYRYAIFIVLTSVGDGVRNISGTLRAFDGTQITTSNVSSYINKPLLLYSDVTITFKD